MDLLEASGGGDADEENDWEDIDDGDDMSGKENGYASDVSMKSVSRPTAGRCKLTSSMSCLSMLTSRSS
jgi:hypothetical protein